MGSASIMPRDDATVIGLRGLRKAMVIPVKACPVPRYGTGIQGAGPAWITQLSIPSVALLREIRKGLRHGRGLRACPEMAEGVRVKASELSSNPGFPLPGKTTDKDVGVPSETFLVAIMDPE